MKKSIFRIFGMAALAAGMLYNVQVSDVASGSDVALSALGNMAAANPEGGAGCVRCEGIDESTCQRVIVGNTAHYFTGPKKPC